MKRRDLLKTSVAAAGLMGAREPTGARCRNRSEQHRERRRRTIVRRNICAACEAIGSCPSRRRRATVSDLAHAAGRTGPTEDCAAAGLLQHRARQAGQREPHLRQWNDEHRVDGRSLRGADPLPSRKPAHAVEEALGGSERRGYFPASAANGAGREKPRSDGAGPPAHERWPDQAGHRAAPHRPGIPDATRFSEGRAGEGLSAHRQFRERRDYRSPGATSTATGSVRLSRPGRTTSWFSGSPRRRVSR